MNAVLEQELREVAVRHLKRACGCQREVLSPRARHYSALQLRPDNRNQRV